MDRLDQGAADKKVVVHTFEWTAAQTDYRPRQARAQQALCIRAKHFATVKTKVECLPALAQWQLEVIAHKHTFFGGQRGFAVEAAHRVAAADGKIIGGVQHAARVLRPHRRGVTQVLTDQLKRHAQSRIQGFDMEVVRRAAVIGTRQIGLRAEPGHAPAIGQRAVELRRAQVVLMLPTHFGITVVAMLDLDRRAVDKRLAEGFSFFFLSFLP